LVYNWSFCLWLQKSMQLIRESKDCTPYSLLVTHVLPNP
jgi:hypothetical protein